MAELVEAGTAETILGLQRLVTRSIECIDAGDRAAFAAAWWDDSVWNLGAPFPEFVGIDAIRQAGEDVLWSVWSLTHHVVGSADIALTRGRHGHRLATRDRRGRARGGSVDARGRCPL